MASSWTPPDLPVEDWNMRNNELMIWSDIFVASSAVIFLKTLCKLRKKNSFSLILLAIFSTTAIVFLFVKVLSCLTHSHTMTPFEPLENKPFENTVGKGEIAHNEQFLLFPVFSTCLGNFLSFSSNLKLSSANSFSLEESKICRLVMG